MTGMKRRINNSEVHAEVCIDPSFKVLYFQLFWKPIVVQNETYTSVKPEVYGAHWDFTT